MNFKPVEVTDFYECEYNGIPKVIYIIWKGEAWPDYANKQIFDWQSKLDSSWVIYHFGNEELEILKRNADEFGKKVINVAESMPEIASYVDIIRLYLIYKNGGYYFDADFEVYNSLDPVSHIDSDLIVSNSTEAYHPYMDNCFFAAKKGNNFLKFCLDKLINRFENSPEEMKNDWIVSRTGPIFFGTSLLEFNGFDRIVKKIPYQYFYRNQKGDALIVRNEHGQALEEVTETFEHRIARHMFCSNGTYK